MSRRRGQRGSGQQAAGDAKPAEPERTLHELMRAIQAGELSGRSLAPAERQRCVAYLIAEGYSVIEASEILKVHERTVQRDKQVIREANALQRDDGLLSRMVGQLVGEAEHALAQLARVARDRETPAAIKVEAAKARFSIFERFVERLQGLGYLPQATQMIRAELTHRHEEPPDVAALEAELSAMATLVQQTLPEGAEVRKQVDMLRAALVRVEVAHGIVEIKRRVGATTNPEQNDERQA